MTDQRNTTNKGGQSGNPSPGQQQGQQGNQHGQHVGMQKPGEGRTSAGDGGTIPEPTGAGGQTGTVTQKGSKDTNRGGSM